jgi:hypothetical protein
VHPYEQDSDIHVVILNRKDKQIITVTLMIISEYCTTRFTIKRSSSSNIKINQDSDNKSSLIIRAIMKSNQEETCSFALKQSH